MIESARLSKTITKPKIVKIDIGGVAFTDFGAFGGVCEEGVWCDWRGSTEDI